MDLVTSSQTLREKDIQPSKLNFGFLGLGKIYRQKDIKNKDRYSDQQTQFWILEPHGEF